MDPDLDATEAIAIFSARERRDPLITDDLMPGMAGQEPSDHARATRDASRYCGE